MSVHLKYMIKSLIIGVILTFYSNTKAINLMNDNAIDDQFICAVNDLETLEEVKPSVLMRQKPMAILEIAIFYDQSFYDKYSSNLNHFLRTLFRQVQIIYEYPTLTEASIRMAVTHKEKVNSNEVPLNSSIFDYRRSLCRWQFERFPPNSRNFDIAVFLSAKVFYSNYFFIHKKRVYSMFKKVSEAIVGSK